MPSALALGPSTNQPLSLRNSSVRLHQRHVLGVVRRRAARHCGADRAYPASFRGGGYVRCSASIRLLHWPYRCQHRRSRHWVRTTGSARLVVCGRRLHALRHARYRRTSPSSASRKGRSLARLALNVETLIDFARASGAFARGAECESGAGVSLCDAADFSSGWRRKYSCHHGSS